MFFIRDPFVLAIYILVLSRRTRIRKGPLEIGCLFGIAGLIMTVAQRIWATGEVAPIMLQAYGWRNYFFYLPLAFVMGYYLDLSDLERVVRMTMQISVAMGMLALVQFASSPLAPINAGFGNTEEELYRNQGPPGEFVRPFGTFTSSLGMGTFTVRALAMALSWVA